jgi:hypothetical protein
MTIGPETQAESHDTAEEEGSKSFLGPEAQSSMSVFSQVYPACFPSPFLSDRSDESEV